jgi:predicted small lipoprotein YifL
VRGAKSLLVMAVLLVSVVMSGCGPQPMERPPVDPQAPVNQVPGSPGTAPGGNQDTGTGLVPPGTPGGGGQ